VSEVSERYSAIADGFAIRLGGIEPSAWAAASPCTEWTARDVVIHVIDTHRRVMASLDGTEAVPVGSGDDLSSAWRQTRRAVSDALADPERAGTTISGMFGEQSFESLVGRLLCTDTLIHSWDLARATGQAETCDPDGTDKALSFLTPIDDAIRRPGGFAPKIDPPPGADAQTRLLSFAGRAV
jgi:uncharacterized protein (TIGR03086 family)